MHPKRAILFSIIIIGLFYIAPCYLVAFNLVSLIIIICSLLLFLIAPTIAIAISFYLLKLIIYLALKFILILGAPIIFSPTIDSWSNVEITFLRTVVVLWFLLMCFCLIKKTISSLKLSLPSTPALICYHNRLLILNTTPKILLHHLFRQ